MTVKCHRLLVSNFIRSVELVFSICCSFCISLRDSLWFTSHRSFLSPPKLALLMLKKMRLNASSGKLAGLTSFCMCNYLDRKLPVSRFPECVKGALIEEAFKKVVAPPPQTSLVGGQVSKKPLRGTQRESLNADL